MLKTKSWTDGNLQEEVGKGDSRAWKIHWSIILNHSAVRQIVVIAALQQQNPKALGKVPTGHLVSTVERGQKISEHIVHWHPGTVLDWCSKLKFADPKKIKVFVLDEADVMIALRATKIRASASEVGPRPGGTSRLPACSSCSCCLTSPSCPARPLPQLSEAFA